MKAFLNLQSFYNKSSVNIELPKNESGHFNIIKVEDLSLSGNKPVSFTRRSYFKVSIVHGHSMIHYADQCMEVADSALVFTNPMIPYYWERISEKQTGQICIFTEDFFSRFGGITDYPVFQSSGHAVIPLNTEEVVQFNNVFLRLLKELESSYTYKYDLLRCLLMELIHEAQKLQPAYGISLLGSNAFERITLLFNELLERQFPIELNDQRLKLNSPGAFANQLNIHVNYLNKALKEITGETTSGLIGNRIMQEAKILLKSTTWPVNEIAWSLGFEEPNHFSSFYKRHTGITPKQFRQTSID